MGKNLSSNLKHKNVLIYFRKYILILFILFITVYLSSCEVVLNCLFDNEPEFETDSLPTAIVNQEYSANIYASVRDIRSGDVPDYCYNDYEFTLEEGHLPDGLKLTELYSTNAVRIEGTPTELGEYKFKLEVYVYVNYDCDDLCTNYAYRDYVITVNSK